MSKRNRVNGQGVPSVAQQVQVDGGNIETLAINGEPWVSPDAYQEAMALIEEQAAEIERLKAGNQQPSNAGEVKHHLRCPSCWNGLGGRAARRKWRRPISGILHERCYVCDQCGTEWVAEVRNEEEDGVLYTTTRIVQVRESVSS